MKSILVIGLGRYGRHVMMKLTEMHHEVMAVDKDEERVNAALQYCTSAQIGDSTDEEFISTLGINNFDACIVAIGDNFQASLVTTDLLKEMGAKKIIARASRGVQEKFLLRNGADEVVYPEKQLAKWTAIRCVSDHILDIIELDDQNSIYELAIPKDWIGKTILYLNIRKKYGVNILGIKRNGKLVMDMIPDTILKVNDSLLVLGKAKEIQKLFHI